MKFIVARSIDRALSRLPDLAAQATGLDAGDTVERTRDARHGDFASNIAMRLAKSAKRAPRQLAAEIVAALEGDADIAKVEIAGPGFINFFLDAGAFHRELGRILDAGDAYGRQPPREGPRILLEFVSANPTGPLHVGHGRLAAYGATLGNLLEAAGYPVDREYYLNDAGRQMDILGVSVWLRRLEALGLAFGFPRAGYRGDYIRDLAAAYDGKLPDTNRDELLDGVPEDGPPDSEHDTAEQRAANKAAREAYVEALVARALSLLTAAEFDAIRQYSLEAIRADIEADLAEFGVRFDRWFSEQSVSNSGRVDEALDVLRKRGLLYERDGAEWFPSTRFGDEKDRVVVRNNGVRTYFASDIAYHFDKRQRGYDLLIDVLGADHHGYVARVRAGLEAMGYAAADLEVELVQFVALFRAGRKVRMSTRSGEFDTLRELRREVGNDAARLFYVLRSNDQHLDFDLDIAKSSSNDNPVFYIQYAHARIAAVFARLTSEFGLDWNRETGLKHLPLLVEPREKALISALSRYPEVLDTAANKRAPQHLVHYLRDLAHGFHTWYAAHRFIDVDDPRQREARLTLAKASGIVLANGLGILGVSAPESM